MTKISLTEKEVNDLLNVLSNEIIGLEEDEMQDKWTQDKTKRLNRIYDKIMKNRVYVK